MKINIREVNREWAVDLETPDKIQSIYFKSRQNALSFVKYLELADNVIKLDKKELQAPMTNYDRIKAISVEEMAVYFFKFLQCDNCVAEDFFNKINSRDDDLVMMSCSQRFKQWLESEVSK